MNQSTMQLSEQVEANKVRVENALKAELTNAQIEDPKLLEAMEYSLLFGGKRIRPFLVYATGTMFQLADKDLDAIACALEAIHSYSLIHDDLPAMDDDDLRRGHPTCHKAFDEATAILAGDTLQSFAFGLLANHAFESVPAERVIRIVAMLADSATAMCAGQSIDLQQTNNPSATSPADKFQALRNMHKLKTGALIKAAVLMPAICASAKEEELNSLTTYADNIGLAFQVWDDVLDIISDTDTLGKPQGSDESANKMTYPALLGLEEAKQKAVKLVEEAVQALQQLPYNTEILARLANYIIERDH
jgi:farnesyl diphosphate synthase